MPLFSPHCFLSSCCCHGIPCISLSLLFVTHMAADQILLALVHSIAFLPLSFFPSHGKVREEVVEAVHHISNGRKQFQKYTRRVGAAKVNSCKLNTSPSTLEHRCSSKI